MDKFFAELSGTFFLVLAIGLAAGADHAGNLAPLAIGGVLMAMIFAGGHISDAHYNPAVTLAMWIRGRCKSAEIPIYLAAQLLGSGSAALAVGYLAGGKSFDVAPIALGPALLAELLFTFALCWVILNVATTLGTAGNSFYGLAIASTVTGAIYAVGPISGAVLNPAVAAGLCIMGLASWSSIWAYTLVELVGALLAALAFRTFVRE